MFVVVVVFVTSMIKSPLMGIIQHIFVWRLRLLGATNARCSICFLKNSMWKYISLQRNLVVAFGRKPMAVIDGFLNAICLMTQMMIRNYYDTFEQMAEAIEEELCGEKPENFEDAEGILSKYDLDEHIFAHEVEYTSLSDF